MRHIRTKLAVYFFSLAMASIFLTGIGSYYVARRSLVSDIRKLGASNLNALSRSMDNEIDRVNTIMYLLSNNELFVETLRELSPDPGNYRLYSQNHTIDTIVQSMLFNYNTIESIVFLGRNGSTYVYNAVPTDTIRENLAPVIKELDEAGGRIVWRAPSSESPLGGAFAGKYIAGRMLRDTAGEKDLQDLGELIFVIEPNVFSFVFHQAGTSASTLVLTPFGRVMTGLDDAQGLQDQAARMDPRSAGEVHSTYTSIDGRRYYASSLKSDATGWSVVQFMPVSEYTRDIRFIAILTSLIAFACAVAVLGVSALLSRRISLPINQLAWAMVEVSRRHFDVSVPVVSDDELGSISAGFNEMAVEIRELFDKTVRREREMRDAQLRALQFQINPHFIYNTLGSIRLTALMENDHRTAEMLRVLSRLLRNTISKTTELVPLRLEMQNLADYMTIKQIQYQNRIIAETRLDPPIEECRIPGMLFQPIVENALVHGLSDRLNNGGGRSVVSVSGRLDGEDLLFEIRDNGKGMTKAEIESVFREYPQSSQDAVEIGIRNIHERIQYRFGERYGLRIESVPGEYTLVIMKLPVIRDGGSARAAERDDR